MVSPALVLKASKYVVVAREAAAKPRAASPEGGRPRRRAHSRVSCKRVSEEEGEEGGRGEK